MQPLIFIFLDLVGSEFVRFYDQVLYYKWQISGWCIGVISQLIVLRIIIQFSASM